MSAGPGVAPAAGRRRVRHEARDALAVMGFSLCASVGVALAFGLLLGLGK